jgi:hypothetical protein
MSQTDKLIVAMRRNPAGDWSIGDVQRLADHLGWTCLPPSGGGSHWKITAAGSDMILTVPAKRPIKAVYIRRLIALMDEVGNHGKTD